MAGWTRPFPAALETPPSPAARAMAMQEASIDLLCADLIDLGAGRSGGFERVAAMRERVAEDGL